MAFVLILVLSFYKLVSGKPFRLDVVCLLVE